MSVARAMGRPPMNRRWSISEADKREDQLERRLRHCHGSERAAEIIDGHDRASEADVKVWRRLGL